MSRTGLIIAAMAPVLALAFTMPLLAYALPYDDNKTAIASVADISTKGLTRRESRELNDILVGRKAGEARQCISIQRVRRSTRFGDDILIYEMRSGDILVNRTRNGCRDVGNASLITKTNGDRLCRGQIFEVRDFETGITLSNCAYGDFVEYNQIAEESAD